MNKETSEIATLTERISREPKSKLFVPLAEEYKKIGDIEMAISVLLEGLNNNPGYVTARSVLGKLLLEKGDLAGSQKEFEEVVKAIPDNLMAQRKLGDLFVLQNRPDEAIKHYKTVFSLNTRDEELASLISDLEAGRDVRSRIQQPKPQSVPEKAVEQKLPAGVPPTPKIQPQAGASETSILIEASPAPVPREMEDEEPEEVLLVEPLEAVNAEPEAHDPGFEFPVEKEGQASAESAAEKPPEFTMPEGDQFKEETAVIGAFSAEAETGENTGKEEASSAYDEMPMGADFEGEQIADETVQSSTAEASEDVFSMFPDATAAIVPEAVQEKADDFTTDTLAELYIAQGFHEKAIDIYQRMLADKPNSKGLKDKLSRVREMATQAAPVKAAPSEEAIVSKKTEDSVFSEPGEYIPVVEEEIVIDAEIIAESIHENQENNLFTQSQEYQPAVAREEQPETEREPGFDVFASPVAQDQAREKPSFSDFEPREYVPPKAEPESVEMNADAAVIAPKPSGARKKETIDRLETWLKTIKKER